MKSNFLLLLLLCFCFTAHAQDGIRRTAVHGYFGTWGLGGAAAIAAEHSFGEQQRGFIPYLALRGSYGWWGTWGQSGHYQQLALVALTGKRSSHFELTAGMARLEKTYNFRRARDFYNSPSQPPLPTGAPETPRRSNYDEYVPTITVGYRYQRRLIFRTGIGYPEGVYLGTGVAF